MVCTGGEPLLQLDEDLVDALHDRDFEVAVETNGTIRPPRGLDWITVSPKAGTDLVLRSGQELKFVYPQPDLTPEEFQELDFGNFFLQPMDGPEVSKNTELALQYCLGHPALEIEPPDPQNAGNSLTLRGIRRPAITPGAGLLGDDLTSLGLLAPLIYPLTRQLAARREGDGGVLDVRDHHIWVIIFDRSGSPGSEVP